MADTKELIEKAERFLKQQKDMYGDFSLSFPEKNPSNDPDKEVQQQAQQTEQVQEESQDYETKTAVDNADAETTQPEPVRELSKEEKIAACQNLDELRALCEEAEELRTDLEDTNLVFGVGDPHADLMIVGEAPGYYEDQQGEPFVGDAGQLLDKILDAINFKRDDIYIANILKHRPPNNRDPKQEERQRSLPYLLRQIELVDPKLILCVGRVSATTLLDEDTSLSRLRGKFHPFHGRELMATYHPAALLRNQQWKRPTWEDVQKLRKHYDELGGK